MRYWSLLLVAFVACARQPDVSQDGGDSGGDDGGPGPRADADPNAPDAKPVVGCPSGGGVAQPFGNHGRAYASGVIIPSHVSVADLDDGVREVYDDWKAMYLEAGCGDGRYYVDVHEDDSMTVSEAHGYGMLLTAYMAGHDPNARTEFDGLYYYYTDHPSDGDSALMSWSQNHSCQNNNGDHSASDGDLDIAYALLLADKQWGSDGDIDYFGEAMRVIAGIARSDVDSTGSWVLLGDWALPSSGQYYQATRPSDFMPGHLAAFEHAVGDGRWDRLLDRSYDMISSVQSSHSSGTGLVPDFVLDPIDDPYPAPPNFLERSVDGEYSYNACRVPWRIGVHVATTGDARGRAALQPINQWLRGATGDNPGNIAAGYRLDGDGLPGSDYLDMSFVGPFGVGAMVSAENQVWLNNVWETVRSPDMTGVYYGDTLRVLAMLAMSGNWWTPEATPCPD